MNSNPQTDKFALQVGAAGYRSRSDITATSQIYLVPGSQNMLINESVDDPKKGDKVETRAGYELLGDASTDRIGTKNEFTFKTKSGDRRLLRFLSNGDLELFLNEVWEILTDGLDGDFNCRFATVWDSTELIRQLLFVNHSDKLNSWSGASGTLASVSAGTIDINEDIGEQGFMTATGSRSIRIKDSTGVWRETVYTNQSGTTFTVSSDLSGFIFDPDAPVMQSILVTDNTPADGFINDVITVAENHVYIGSHSSSVVYMSKSTDFKDYTFSSPRVATDGWQFVLDDFTVGFSTNISSDGKESVVMFAGNDWIYRVSFIDLSTADLAQIASVKPIIVSSGQGAVSQELIAKVKNSIIFLNAFNELLELGSIENVTTLQQTPLSDPIKPDFLAADFTGGNIRFQRNNLFVTAPASSRMFIYAFRDNGDGTSRRFWQPPQILPVGQLSDYQGDLIGHASGVSESYALFTGTNDNGKPIAFKAHFAYNSYGAREKLKNFDKYFSELYITSNTTVKHSIVFEYLGAKKILEYLYKGSELAFIFVPSPSASLGINSLGTSPLGSLIEDFGDYLKYRRFKKITPVDFFEQQTRYEADDIDARFQILCHGPEVVLSRNAPAKITS